MVNLKLSQEVIVAVKVLYWHLFGGAQETCTPAIILADARTEPSHEHVSKALSLLQPVRCHGVLANKSLMKVGSTEF